METIKRQSKKKWTVYFIAFEKWQMAGGFDTRMEAALFALEQKFNPVLIAGVFDARELPKLCKNIKPRGEQ